MNKDFLLGQKLNKLEQGTFEFESENGNIIVIITDENNIKKCILFKDNKIIKKIEILFDDEADYNFIIHKYKTSNTKEYEYTKLLIYDKNNSLISKELNVKENDFELRIINDSFSVSYNNENITSTNIIKDNDKYILKCGDNVLTINKKDFNKVYLNLPLENPNIDTDNSKYLNEIIKKMIISIEMYEKYSNLLNNEDIIDNSLLEYIDSNFKEETVLKPIKKVRK